LQLVAASVAAASVAAAAGVSDILMLSVELMMRGQCFLGQEYKSMDVRG